MGVNLSDDPAAAHDNVILVEHRSLAGRNCALGLVEGDEHFVGAGLLDQCRGWLMAVTDFDGDSHRFAQIFDCNKIDAACAKRARVKFLLIADNYLELYSKL